MTKYRVIVSLGKTQLVFPRYWDLMSYEFCRNSGVVAGDIMRIHHSRDRKQKLNKKCVSAPNNKVLLLTIKTEVESDLIFEWF